MPNYNGDELSALGFLVLPLLPVSGAPLSRSSRTCPGTGGTRGREAGAELSWLGSGLPWPPSPLWGWGAFSLALPLPLPPPPTHPLPPLYRVRACVRACMRRLTCPILPDVNAAGHAPLIGLNHTETPPSRPPPGPPSRPPPHFITPPAAFLIPVRRFLQCPHPQASKKTCVSGFSLSSGGIAMSFCLYLYRE
jgi:hypothetical protein